MRRILFTFLLLISFPSSKVIAQYKIMFSNHYPPYNYLNEEGELVGFSVDILEAIDDLYKTDITVEGAHWDIINQSLQNGTIQAIGGAHYPGIYDNNYIYTRSTISTSHCFFYNSNFKNRFTLEDLRSHKDPIVAMWKNDVLSHYILSINPSAKFVYVTSYDELISNLNNKDITCVFGQRIGGLHFAKKLGVNNIKVIDIRILERNMGFKVSKESPELAEILNNGLEVILANGEYQRIYDKWISIYEPKDNFWVRYSKHLFVVATLIASIILFLIVINWVLQSSVKEKTKNLTHQLKVNSQIMEELEEQKIKAEESDKMKSAFLANMSHEIRTPMNGILGFTDLLKSANYSSEKQAQFISIIQQSGNRMLDTINNIIDVSKLESGLEKIQIKKVNIPEIVSQLYNFFTPEANAKGIQLILKEQDNSYNHFYTDEYKLNSILTNLIKNALKFTNKGSVEIEYSINNEIADFWVKDSGIGIPKNKQNAVFSEFVQADYSHSSGFEGSGLGLSISKGYINLLNGKINLESETNKGTTFHVSLPNGINTEEEISIPKKKNIEKISSHKIHKIIIAEDDETSFYYLKEILEDLVDQIIYAKNGIEAVECAKEHTDADAILMDVKMPKLNGFEATEEIRIFNKNIYIIAQTAYAQENYKVKANNVGCNAFISKPIKQNELLSILNQIDKS